MSFSQEDERINDEFTYDAQPLVHFPNTPPPYTTTFKKPQVPNSNGTQFNPGKLYHK